MRAITLMLKPSSFTVTDEDEDSWAAIIGLFLIRRPSSSCEGEIVRECIYIHIWHVCDFGMFPEKQNLP